MSDPTSPTNQPSPRRSSQHSDTDAHTPTGVPMIDDIDARGRAAASHVRTEASTRPVPTFDPERVTTVPAPTMNETDPRRPARLLLAAAAVIAVIAAGVVWSTSRGEDGQAPAGQVRSNLIRPYLPEPSPEGMKLAGVADIDGSGTDLTGTDAEGGPLITYGPAENDPRLGITVMANEMDLSGGETSETVQIGEQTAVIHDDPATGATMLAMALPGQPDGRTLMVIGNDSGRELVIEVAGQATVEGVTASLDVGRLPDGWRQLGTDPGGLAGASPMYAARGGGAGRAHIATFMGPGGEADQMLNVTVAEADESSAFTQRLFLTDSEVTTVRGKTAVVGRLGSGADGFEAWTLLWVERPGEAISLVGTGMDRRSLEAIAETLQPVEDARWRELLESTKLGDLLGWQDPGQSQEVARGEFADGTGWVLRLVTYDVVSDEGSGDGESSSESAEGTVGSAGDAEDVEAQPTLELTVALSGSSSSSSEGGSAIASSTGEIGSETEPPVFGQLSTTTIDDRTFGTGEVSDAVTKVVLVDRDGKVVAEAELVSGAGIHAWVAEMTPSGGDLARQPVEAVAYDADGNELARRSVPWATGDGSMQFPGDPAPAPDMSTTTIGG